MRPGRWVPMLAAALIRAQAPLQEPAPAPWWQPETELRLRADRITESDQGGVERGSAQLRLRWEGPFRGADEGLRYAFGTRSALGSDGNRLNLRRWDQQPSNGTQLDLAHLSLQGRSERSFGDLRLGFQDLRLLVPEALWDRDLRYLGVGLRAGLRDREGRIPEAGLRVAAGRVRTLQGGRPTFAAVQAVLRADTGPLSWTVHGGRWEVAWDRGFARTQPVPGREADLRQRLRLDAFGGGIRWNGALPVELRAFGQRHRDSGEDSAEVQALVGSLARPFWPRLSVTWQRLSRAGTLFPLNGDEWWYYWNARGHRFEWALPLPDRWFVSLVYLRQQDNGEARPAERRMVTVTRRFPLD